MGQKVLYLAQGTDVEDSQKQFATYLSTSLNKELITISFSAKLYIDEVLKEHDIILVVYPLISSVNSISTQIKVALKLFRNLRMPYLFVREQSTPFSKLELIIAPVGYLPEEKEKASWCSDLGVALKVPVTLIEPKDKGTRARKNVAFIQSVLQKRDVEFEVSKGAFSSHKYEKDVTRMLKVKSQLSALVIISASRDYGLDDLIFGSKELHVIKKVSSPVLVINPRDDIYMLCGD